MSTPGKVLVVLVLLVLPAWIILVSTVAQLNKNAGEQVAKLQASVANLENEISTLKKNITGMKDQISLEQDTMREQLSMLRAQQSDLQKIRSEWIENSSRASYEVGGMKETAKRAEANRDLRANERMQEIAAMQTLETQVEQLKQEHARLTEQLNKLQGEFKTTVDSNRKLLENLKAKKPSRT
jgi:cell division protein FtsB